MTLKIQIRSALEKHFGECGEITRVSIPSDYETGAIKGWVFATKTTNIPAAINLLNLGSNDCMLIFNSPEWHTWTSRIRTLYRKPLSSVALTSAVAMSFMLMKPSPEAMASVAVVDLVADLVTALVAGMVVVADLVIDLEAGMAAEDSVDDVVVGTGDVDVDVVVGTVAVALVTGRVLALLVQVEFILCTSKVHCILVLATLRWDTLWPFYRLPKLP